MSFRVVTQQVIGKHPDAFRCEDRIVINDAFAAVVDGATTKSQLHLSSSKQGVIAGQLIEECVVTLPENATSGDFVASVNARFTSFYDEKGLMEHMVQHPVDRLNASAIVYSRHFNELWMVGDCQALIGEEYVANPKLIDFVLANLRSLVIELELADGKSIDEFFTEDTGRKYIYELLKEQSRFQNSKLYSDFSYGVLDGFPVAPRHIITRKVESSSLVLASDGYPKIFDSFDATEAYLKDVLEKDPLCFRENKSTKGLRRDQISYDDRAYLKLLLR